MTFPIADLEIWKKRMRLIQEDYGLDQTLVIIVGSGLSYDRKQKIGVADVAQLVEWIREKGIEVPEGNLTEQYQRAMEALMKEAGPRSVNQLIRRAILEAYQGLNENLRRTALGAPSESQQEACRMLEQEIEDWRLPRGQLGLAGWVRLIVDQRRQSPKPDIGPIHLVTTNFDPLLEIALKRYGVEVFGFSLPSDSTPKPTPCSAMVWHVHGSWWDVTLHSEDALNHPREGLKKALAGRMKYAQLCVLGYGGWQDVVSSTYSDVFANLDGCADLLWAFFEPTADEIQVKYRDVLERLESAPAFSQVTLFSGIDLHEELPKLVPLHKSVIPAMVPPPKLPFELSPQLWARLREAIEGLRAEAPPSVKSKVDQLVTPKENLPDLCVVLHALTKILEPLPKGKPREGFAAAIWQYCSVLGEAILTSDPRYHSDAETAEAPFEFETATMAECWMAARQHRDWRFGASAGELMPTDEFYDANQGSLLEEGPDGGDWLIAFEGLLWKKFFPHKDYDPTKHRLRLKAELTVQKMDGTQAYVLIDRNQPHGELRGHVPEVRFLFVAGQGTKSEPFDQYLLAALLGRFLTLAPHLESTLTPTGAFSS